MKKVRKKTENEEVEGRWIKKRERENMGNNMDDG